MTALGTPLHDCPHCRHFTDLTATVSDVLENLGPLLADTRQERGLRQRQVAAQTGLSFSTVSRIERGVTSTTDVKSALAILQWIENPPPPEEESEQP